MSTCSYMILRLTVNDLEFSVHLQTGQAKVQLKSEKSAWRGLAPSSLSAASCSDNGGEGMACIVGHQHVIDRRQRRDATHQHAVWWHQLHFKWLAAVV